MYYHHPLSRLPTWPQPESGSQRGRSDSSWPAGGASRTWRPAARGGPPLAVPLSRLLPSGEVGKVAAAAAAVVPAGPVGVAGQSALLSARAAPSPVDSSGGGGRPGAGRALTEGGGRGQGGPWERGPPAQRRPAPGPAGLLPGRRDHGGQRQAEAGGEAPEDAAGHDRPPAQPKVLRLRPARPHLREHDGGLLRLYLLLRQPVSGAAAAWGEARRAGVGAPGGRGGRWGAGGRVGGRGRPLGCARPRLRAGMSFRFRRARVQARAASGVGAWAGCGGEDGAPGASISGPRGAAASGSRPLGALAGAAVGGKAGGEEPERACWSLGAPPLGGGRAGGRPCEAPAGAAGVGCGELGWERRGGRLAWASPRGSRAPESLGESWLLEIVTRWKSPDGTRMNPEGKVREAYFGRGRREKQR